MRSDQKFLISLVPVECIIWEMRKNYAKVPREWNENEVKSFPVEKWKTENI